MKWIAVLLLLTSGAWAQSVETFTDSSHFKDGYMYLSVVNNNYGADALLRVTQTRRTLFELSAGWVDSVGVGQTIDSIVCSLKVVSPGGLDDTLRAYPVWKAGCWVEGAGTFSVPTTTGMSWADWNGPDYEWGTAGCDQATDAQADNCTDGASGYDRHATPCDSICSIPTGTYPFYAITLPGTYCQQMYVAGKAVAFLLIGNGTLAYTDFHSRQATTASYRPKAYVYYHAAPTGPTGGSATGIWMSSSDRGSIWR